jgi:hypothetical protein
MIILSVCNNLSGTVLLLQKKRGGRGLSEFYKRCLSPADLEVFS